MKKLIALLALTASPAMAATGPFLSLKNTDFVVLLAFLVFVAVIIMMKVPGKLMGLLDKRAENIQAELNEARALREEAQTILASYERKQAEVQEQSKRIVEQARVEAVEAAAAAKADLEASIARRLQAAEEQIASAETSALREVRDRAVSVAVSAAAEVIAKKVDATAANAMIDDAIAQVESKLH